MKTPQPASHEEIDLFCYMGRACTLCRCKQALSFCITLKLNDEATKAAADEKLSMTLRFTLEKASNIAEQERLIPQPLYDSLFDFLQTRNWLVHQAMFESKSLLEMIQKKA